MGAATVKRWLPPIRPSSSSSPSSSWYPDNFVVDPDVVDDHIAGTDVGPLVKYDADRCNIPGDAALAAREGSKRRIEPDLPPTRLRVLGLRPVHAAEETSPHGPGYHVKPGRPCATVAVRHPEVSFPRKTGDVERQGVQRYCGHGLNQHVPHARRRKVCARSVLLEIESKLLRVALLAGLSSVPLPRREASAPEMKRVHLESARKASQRQSRKRHKRNEHKFLLHGSSPFSIVASSPKSPHLLDSAPFTSFRPLK